MDSQEHLEPQDNLEALDLRDQEDLAVKLVHLDLKEPEEHPD